MKITLADIIDLDKNEIKSSIDLTQTLIRIISNGYLAPGSKLPSINEIASQTTLNRLTVLKSMDELEIEGWVVKKERSGIYISECLPIDNYSQLQKSIKSLQNLPSLAPNSLSILKQNFSRLSFNDGYPDYRLFPNAEMARAYSTAFKDNNNKESILYYDVYGQKILREAISNYIHKTRHIKNKADNIMVTRGSTMGIYLSIKCICTSGDKVAMSIPGYYLAKEAFINENIEVLEINVDKDGLDIDELKQELKKNKIKMIYVTPHHHYPTTVTMSAEKRMELLNLAEEHNFYILEDDYDFEFQYDRRPILPIASIDQLRRVIYIGGYSKSLSPAIRLGYIVANEDFIKEAGKWRKIIDRQGDSIQELAFSKLLNSGLIERTIRKSHKIYQKRRDFTYKLIIENLTPVFEPQFCFGGLALWTKINMTKTHLDKFLHSIDGTDFYLNSPYKYTTRNGFYTRLGFASMTTKECEESINLIKKNLIS